VHEFLDLRTLSINNIVMSLSLAACLLIYSTYHSEFRGVKQTAYAFIISSIASLLVVIRSQTPDIISFVLPNTLFVLSMAFIHLGFVYFYQFDDRKVKRFHGAILLMMVAFTSFFTYVDHSNNVNVRIAILSFFVSIQCIYIMRTLLKGHNKANLTLAISYLIFSLFFLVRGLITLTEDPIDDFMNASLIHSLSVVVYELLVAVTSFGMVWIVSYSAQRALLEQASHDPLTKVLNRRALESTIDTEHARSLRNDSALSVIMLDIDHFKRINDRFGHARGDEVLIDIASVLTQNTRPYDSIARFGGEEFIILLPNTSVDQAEVIAENLRVKIAEHNYNFKPEDGINVTASFGVTECNLVKEGWLNILERADSGLYKAKAEGRNKVVVHNTNNEDADPLGSG